MERLKELLQKKKKEGKLSPSEFKELKELQKKAKDKKPEERTYCGQPGNDFSWWSKEPELLRDSANFKSNYIPGTPVDRINIPWVPYGVLQINLESVFGPNSIPTDPINIWARDLYLRMFQKYRGISSYTAADLGITILAAVEAVKLIAYYERIYGILNRYSKLNLNMPAIELNAVGVTTTVADYLRGHLSDFRYDLNLLIKKAQRLCIPKDMSIVADAISLFGYEYLDHDNPRGQFVLFTLDKYGVYSDTNVSSGGSITFKTLATDLFDTSADNMCKALSNVLDALLGSDSVQKISGDLVVWFGEESMLQFAPVPSEYLVLPVFSESILHKVHNVESMFANNYYLTTAVHKNMSSTDKSYLENGEYHVYQYNDCVVSLPVLTRNPGTHVWSVSGDWEYYQTNVDPEYMNGHILDTYREDMIPETVTEGALFKYHGTPLIIGGNKCTVVNTCVFYIVRELHVIGYDANGTIVNPSNICVCTQSSGAASWAGQMSLIDWAPLVYYVTNGAGITTTVYGDVDRLVALQANDLIRLQRTCLLSGLHTDITVIAK